MTMKRKEVSYTTIRNKYGIPKYEIEALVKFILPKIQEFYANEENRKEFEKWKQEQEIMK